MLIVIGLITLIVTLAIPAFSVITGGRSIDASENQASAFLGRVRQDALALQDPRGAIVFQDPNTGRVALTEVYFDQPAAAPYRLERFPDRDELLLPTGVGGQAIADGGGFLPIGVILFNGSGQLLVKQYNLSQSGPDLLARLNGLTLTPGVVLSQFGFVLYDQAAYADQNAANPNFVRDNGVPYLVNRYNGTLMRGE